MKSRPGSLAAVLALASIPAAARAEKESPSAEARPLRRRTRGDSKSTRRQRQQRRQQRGRRHPERQRRATAARTDAAPGCGPTAGTRRSPYLGCFADRKNDRAFPFELHAGASRAKRLGHGAQDCERECGGRGYRYFGRQFRGQCFCGSEIEGIVRHGRFDGKGGCDCCGANVGPGRMCVWEDTNHKDSQAIPPSIPVILPQLQPAPTTSDVRLMYSHFAGLSLGSTLSNNGNQHTSIHKPTPSRPDNNSNQMAMASSTAGTSSSQKPTGAFRIRLHWQRGYNWQGSPGERFWCMECRGSCRSGDSVQIDECSGSARQKFLAVARTVRPASDPSLCLTVTGYSGKRSPVRLRDCRAGAADQDFREVREDVKFELIPASNRERCLSQHHHPRRHEAVFPETCEKTRRFDTTYWKTY